MTVTAHDQKVRAAVSGRGQQDIMNIRPVSGQPLHGRRHVPPCKEGNKSGRRYLSGVGGFVDGENIDALSMFNELRRVLDGASGGPAAIPANSDPRSSELALMDIRNNQDRPTRLDQSRLQGQFV